MSQPNSMKKEKKRRLKKLKKRALDGGTHDFCGICTRSEWMEFMSLLEQEGSNQKTIGATIRAKEKKDKKKEVLYEGSIHRDLIASCLHFHNPLRTGTSKKRRRNEDPIVDAAWPAWAALQNPGALENVVVLEVQCENTRRMSASLKMAAEEITSCATLPTRWFQGDRPRATTDSLLYFSTSDKSEIDSSIIAPQNLEELVAALHQFQLDTATMKSEGYPEFPVEQLGTSEASESIDRAKEIQDPQSITYEEASKFLNSHGFHLGTQARGDTSRFIRSNPLPAAEAKECARIFSLDCEMIKTAIGSELARVSIIELLGFDDDKLETKLVLETLVKPTNTVLDYLTVYSGITASLLDGVETRLEQVQFCIGNFFHESDILVGHSLENDLQALHWCHPTVVDTAVLFRPSRQRRTKFSLRHLTNVLLGRQIQGGPSHCSEEDALAAMELAVRRARQGPSFGIATDQRVSLFSSLSNCKVVCLGPGTWIQRHVTNEANGVHALSCNTLAESRKALVSWMSTSKPGRRPKLLWASIQLSPSEDSSRKEATLNCPLCDLMMAMIRLIFPSTVIVLALQEGISHAQDLARKRKLYQDPRSSFSWSSDQEDEWRDAVDRARNGHCMFFSTKSIDKKKCEP